MTVDWSEPAERLPRAAVVYWRVQVAAVALLLLGTVGGAAGPLWMAAAAVVAAAAVMVLPEVLWRRWRYEIRPDAVDLRHGLFAVKRTLVPIRRVQHVETSTGPLQSAFGLSSVQFHTAAGSNEIPAVDRATAEAVRRRVAELARTRDDT